MVSACNSHRVELFININFLQKEQDAYLHVEFIGFLCCRCDGCESVLRSIEKQIQRANSHKEKKQKQKIQVEAEVNDVKQTGIYNHKEF